MLLTQAVRRQLEAAVPVGILLSGGVDSSLLAALAKEIAGRPLHAVIVAHPSSPDAAAAVQVMEQLGGFYSLVPIDTTAEGEADFQRYLDTLDQPVADFAGYLTWVACRQARALGLKVLLSGAGADELFGGYRRHQAVYGLQRLSKIVPLPWLSRLSALAPITMADSGWRQLLRALRPTWGATIPALTALRALPAYLNHPALNLVPEVAPAGFSADPLRQALAFDFGHYLPGDVLALSDQSSAAWGVELRVPYLDEDLVAFAQALPSKVLMRHRPKWMLRRLLAEQDLGWVGARQKHGFGLGLAGLMRQGYLINSLNDDSTVLSSYLRPRGVASLKKRLMDGEDVSADLFALVILEGWLARHPHLAPIVPGKLT
jgi:asparagine synthase (glutamine-hydrolysing)